MHPKSWPAHLRRKLMTARARLAVKTNAVVPLSRELEVESRMEKAVLAYSPQAYPGRVALLVSREYLNETNRKLESVWSTLAAGGVDVRVTTGHHLTVFDEPHVWTLANEFTVLYQESLPAKASQNPSGIGNKQLNTSWSEWQPTQLLPELSSFIFSTRLLGAYQSRPSRSNQGTSGDRLSARPFPSRWGPHEMLARVNTGPLH